MGREVARSRFSAEEYEEFHLRLREETARLKRWFDERAFDHSDSFTTGMELEAWLTDGDHLPAPANREFITAMDDARVVPELARFNFELNIDPKPLDATCLTATHDALAALWSSCRREAERLGLKPVAVGILPTVRDDMLTLEAMSDSNRYRALNDELLRRHGPTPIHIRIEGEDLLDYHAEHIMLEAACTSLQAHLKVNQDEAVRFYNASIAGAGPILAAAVNSPYLYGCALWHETRIAAFEQSTAIHGFRDAHGREVLRVTLGTEYLKRSFFELFLENLSYPDLLPALFEDDDRLPHLCLQNGTIWRWNRPIVGFDGDGRPHLRIEQRVLPAGPTLKDCIANLSLYLGLTLALGRADTPPETETPFEDARANFYACARHGLDAQVTWAGKVVDVQSLLLDTLLPAARDALARAGLGSNDLVEYIDEILHPRILSGRNGAAWQRSFVARHGKDFQRLTEQYAELQAAGAPVHTWAV